MDTVELYSSGFLQKGEEISSYYKANLVISDWEEKNGLLVFTNKRFLFLTKPSGFHAKGFDVFHSIGWGNVLSASTSGLMFKRVNVNIKMGSSVAAYQFACGEVEKIAKRMAQCKNNYVEPTTIEATKVIIEEATKDNAMVILQKRLARGEITLEEFHKLVTRT